MRKKFLVECGMNSGDEEGRIVTSAGVWPENVAEVYRELAGEDMELTELMWPLVKETWPPEVNHEL